MQRQVENEHLKQAPETTKMTRGKAIGKIKKQKISPEEHFRTVNSFLSPP